MDEDNTAALDAITEGEGDGAAEGITNEADKFKNLAESYRVRAEKAEAKLKASKGDKAQTFDPEAFKKEAREAAREELEQRDLDDLEYSDTIKDSIKRIAQLNNVSIRKASQDPYIKHMLEQEETTRRLTEAAENGAKKGIKGSYDPGKPLNPADFDLSTEEGRKEWAEAKAARRSQK